MQEYEYQVITAQARETKAGNVQPDITGMTQLLNAVAAKLD